jgi:hypothetical protein
MTNAEIIVTTLDSLLDHEVTLVVYGRASIALGFDNAPESVGMSLDLDVILPFTEVDKIEADDQFWDAQQKLNANLQSTGLYLSHIFVEDQVFLRPDWMDYIEPVVRPSTRCLKLFRPSTLDVILTKMMRGADRQDMDDIQFLVQHDGIKAEDMEQAFASARIPDIEEFKIAFQKARECVRMLMEPSISFNHRRLS